MLVAEAAVAAVAHTVHLPSAVSHGPKPPTSAVAAGPAAGDPQSVLSPQPKPATAAFAAQVRHALEGAAALELVPAPDATAAVEEMLHAVLQPRHMMKDKMLGSMDELESFPWGCGRDEGFPWLLSIPHHRYLLFQAPIAP